MAELELIVAASYTGAVGFGDVFDCEVESVVAGTLDQERLRLSILPSDADTLRFVLAHLSPERLKIGFALHQRGEPYGHAPISGFVDRSQTSWKIATVEQAPDPGN